MASGIKALRRIQIGPEASGWVDNAYPPAAGIAATEFLVGTLGMRMDQPNYMPSELETGRFAAYDRSHPIARDSGMPFTADANYEQLKHILNMAIPSSNPTTTGTGAAATTLRTYSSLITTRPAIGGSTWPRIIPYTIEYGDDIQAFETASALCSQFTLSGQAGNVVQVQAQLFGREMVQTTFTGSLTAPTELEPVRMSAGKLFYGTQIGTSYTSPTHPLLADFSYSYNAGFRPVKFLDGRYDYSELAQGKRAAELEMTVGFNTLTSGDWWGKWRNQERFAVALAFWGSNADTYPARTAPTSRSGDAWGTASRNRLTIELSGFLTEYREIGEREGQDIVRVKMVSAFDEGVASSPDTRIVLNTHEDSY